MADRDSPMRETGASRRSAGADGIWSALDAARVAVAIVDADARIRWTSTAFGTLFAAEVHQLDGRTVDELLPRDAAELVGRALERARRGDTVEPTATVILDSFGSTRHVAWSAARTSAWPGTDPIAVVVDELTTERRLRRAHQRSNLDMVRRATLDPLTGLPNRANLELILASALRRASRDHALLAVLFCDLDGFKAVNDEHGHATGDALLQWVGRRMSHQLRNSDTLARLGGDEFVVVAEDIVDGTAAVHLARRLIAAVDTEAVALGATVRVGMSVGVHLSRGEHSSHDLLAEADRALYQAKRSGKGRAVLADDGRSDGGPPGLP